jgi:hypothetical protein
VLVADNMSHWSHFASFSFGLVLISCAVEPADDSVICEEGKCDGLEFLDQLNGREDPIAKWMRSLAESKVIDSSGVYHGDRAGEVAPANDPLFYAKLVGGLIQVQGCGEGSLINYALSDDLISGTPDIVYPRLVSTVCSDNNELATNAFVATLGEPAADGDLDLDELEMFAWDATQQKYFFYATNAVGEGKLQVEVEPARCSKCHTTPRDVDPIGMPRLPIMNELTKPWTHWNAGDGGVSESFTIPDSIRGKPLWERFGVGTVAAASRLEKVIRDANALRVTPARSKNLFKPAKIDEAMGLIRPLFCDEQVNYVSELNTGELSVDAVVSGGIKGAFRGIQSTWPWEWFNNDNIQLPNVTEEQRLFMLPVRGVAEVTFEAQLHSVLSPAHILAIRALDYKKPAFSEFRCNLWREAWTEFQVNPPALSGRNRDAVKLLFEEIMKRGGMSTRGLTAGKFVVLDVATETSTAALREAVSAGSVPATCGAEGFCEVEVAGFGELLDAHVKSLEDPAARETLLIERNRRVCDVHTEVAPAGGHSIHGAGARIANDPSFLRVPSGSSTGVSTTPRDCP